jgi:hypothetical protein
MNRVYKSGFDRQNKDFYRTPESVTEALLRRVRLPKGIWEPCCGDGAMARVLEAHGHHVVSTDLVYRGYGEGDRDFLTETRLPDGITAIVTNPPYGGELLRRIVDHALELTRPVGGMVVMLTNSQWSYSEKNSLRCRIRAFDREIKVIGRIKWFEDVQKADGTKPNRPKENHCWQVWDHSRTPGIAGVMFANKNPKDEPEARTCIVCRTPLPPAARPDARLCSATCRQRAKRLGMAQRRTA